MLAATDYSLVAVALCAGRRVGFPSPEPRRRQASAAGRGARWAGMRVAGLCWQSVVGADSGGHVFRGEWRARL